MGRTHLKKKKYSSSKTISKCDPKQTSNIFEDHTQIMISKLSHEHKQCIQHTNVLDDNRNQFHANHLRQQPKRVGDRISSPNTTLNNTDIGVTIIPFDYTHSFVIPV